MVTLIRRAVNYGAVLVALSSMTWAQSNTCDVNADGVINVVDVQLITNMQINAPGFTCSVNVGGLLGCTDDARQTVIKAALGSGCHFVYLTWTASSSAGVVGYNIYRGTSPGGESATPINTGGPVAGTAYTDVTAGSGITYFYFLRATDGTNLSPASTEVSATAL